MVKAGNGLVWPTVVAFARRVTVDQWRAIDEEHRTESVPDLTAAAVLVTAAVCLVLSKFFGQPEHVKRIALLAHWSAQLPHPQLHAHLYWALFKLLNYGLLPYLCVRLWGGGLRDFGLRWVETRAAVITYACMLLIVLPCVFVVSSTPAFLRTYPKCAGAADGLGYLLVWEIAYGLQFFMLELFFRGFMLFKLARSTGSLAIFVMIVPYAMIHFGKPLAECLGSILAGIALGTVALRTGSIWGGVVVHCVAAWSMDLLALWRTDRLWPLFSG